MRADRPGASSIMHDWTPNLAASDKPRYLAIADAIADDIRSGRLTASARLPPQRKLARRLDIDFTTVARGYVEAQKRGLIESHVGRGTFVRGSARRRHSPMARHPEIVDLSMNLPPEPDDPELLDRMQDGLEAVGRDLVSLLRYQGFGGVQADKDAASNWLSRRALVPPQDRLFIAPRSEEHTSELQSRSDLVCRLLLEKKKKNIITFSHLKKTKKKKY